MAFLSWMVSWSLRNRPVVLVGALLFVLLGLRAATALKIDAVPDVTSMQVQVITSAPALTPVEIERYVTIPVERAMAGLPRSTEIRSVSKYGISVVTIVFSDDTSIYFARQLVSERLPEVRDALPSQYGKPELGPIASGLGEIFQFTIRNEKLSLMQLEELLDWTVRPQLRMVPGVVEVNTFGGERKQYHVIVDPGRLQAAGISINEVVQALEKANGNAGGGYIEHQGEHFVIGSEGFARSVEDLRAAVIRSTPEGVPTTVGSLADVRIAPRLRRGAASQDARGEVVVGVALMLMGENSRIVTEGIKSKLADLQASLPPGTRIEPFYDRSELVAKTTHTIGRNLLEGALLVIGVLFLLLGDLRAGLVVATTIPLALLFAVLIMNACGFTGNLMSLGAIDFGLIVDGAVIIVENAVRRLSERQQGQTLPLTAQERADIVGEATLEVRAASIFGEAIIAIVYLPILALIGMEGKLFRPMAVTVLLALAGAFLLSLTLVPVLTSYFVRPLKGHQETWILRKAHAGYVPLLGRVLARPRFTIAAALLGLTVGIALFGRIGAEFVPQLDEGEILVEARRLPGVALTESIDMDRRMQKTLLQIPEVSSVVSKTGAPELANDPMGMEQSDAYISLKDRSDWRPGLTKEALAEEVSSAVETNVPEVAASISQPIQMRTNELVGGIRSDVALLVYGSDMTQLESLGKAAAQILRGISGAVDVRVEQVSGLKYLRVIPDRAKLGRYGLSIDDVNLVTESLAVGHTSGEIFEQEKRFDLVVRSALDFNGDLSPLLALPLQSPSGQLVPLGEVAELKFETGPAQVSREGLARRLIVEFNVRGRDLLSVVEESQAAIARELRVPTGYRLAWGGQFEHYTEAKARLAFVVPLALGLIFFLLWLAFRSIRTAWLIFLNVPFAIIGGVLALWIRDIPFSISAGVGFIALFGVAVLNGLVLVSFSRQLEQAGQSPAVAIRQAAEMRLRPVLMTALVAALGFVPMALSTAPGSEVQRPLATVVIGGLVTATLLTLFVLPIVYTFFGGTRERAV